MALNRDLVPIRVSALLDDRPTRWAPADRLVGDYDGRVRTLEVFDARAGDQRVLLRRLRPLRQEIEEQIGGPLIIVFHTPSETKRLYPEVESLRLGFRRLKEPLPNLENPSPAEYRPDPSVADPPYEEAA